MTGELWNRFYGRVLVPADCAEEVAKVFDIPYAAIYPLYPGNTYYFDDFTLKVYPGAHATTEVTASISEQVEFLKGLTKDAENLQMQTRELEAAMSKFKI